jgi:hypothetical protein
LPSENSTKTRSASTLRSPRAVVTTWAFVAMKPSPSSTKPEPWPPSPSSSSRLVPPPKIDRIVTTPGDSRS